VAGRHTYTLTASAVGAEKVDVPFVLDTFVCK
jgi:hypothetical protein